jgi:hypothetical protein
MLLPRIYLAALPVLLAAPALACVAVEQDRVLAKDLVPENAWFARLDPGLEIALTPLAGITRVIKSGELAALTRRNRIIVEIPGSFSSLCVERAAAPLTPEGLQPVLEQVLGGSPVRILDYSRYPVPRGEIEFTRAGLTTAGLWRGRVIYGNRHSTPVWAKVALEPGGAESSAAQPRWDKPREIERGEQVTVEVTSGGARLAFQATAQSAGHAGDFVLVRNPENGRLFQAKVLGNGKVLIHK